jgi:chromosome partitioning protein
MAAELTRKKRRVLLIDADPQGSALAWSNLRDKSDFTVVGMPKATIHKEIESLAEYYDDVIIDGPPRVTELARSIILASDIILIPLQPSPMDVWAAAETIDLVREAQTYKPDLGCCLIVNRRISNTAIGRDVRVALKELEVPTLKTDIVQRVAFAETAASGSTVVPNRLSKAAKEIRKLVDEIRRIA